MNLLAVIGRPVSHSLSPILHSYAAKLAGLRVLSFRCELEPNMLGRFAQKVRENPCFLGFNVTMPYKSQILRHLDQLDQVVSKLGAANTVVNRSGRLFGYNTDWVAVRGAVESRASGLEKALVVGAGGAAAAAIQGLLCPRPLVRELYVYNRSKDRLEALRRVFPEILVHELSGKYDLLVNATPQPVFCFVGPDLRANIVLDFPYTYFEEGLHERFSAMGAKYIDGLELLARQGVEAVRLFLGVAVDHLPVYERLKAHLAAQPK